MILIKPIDLNKLNYRVEFRNEKKMKEIIKNIQLKNYPMGKIMSSEFTQSMKI